MKIVPGEHRCKETRARLWTTSNSYKYFYFRHADHDLTFKCSHPAYGLQWSLGGIITTIIWLFSGMSRKIRNSPSIIQCMNISVFLDQHHSFTSDKYDTVSTLFLILSSSDIISYRWNDRSNLKAFYNALSWFTIFNLWSVDYYYEV